MISLICHWRGTVVTQAIEDGRVLRKRESQCVFKAGLALALTHCLPLRRSIFGRFCSSQGLPARRLILVWVMAWRLRLSPPMPSAVTQNRPTITPETLTPARGLIGSVGMSNVLSEEKKQQVLAPGRLGWPLRRIEQATGVRRETAGAYLKAAGIVVRPPGAWGRRAPAKPANEVTTDSGAFNPASEVITDLGTAKPANEVTCASPKFYPLGESGVCALAGHHSSCLL